MASVIVDVTMVYFGVEGSFHGRYFRCCVGASMILLGYVFCYNIDMVNEEL